MTRGTAAIRTAALVTTVTGALLLAGCGGAGDPHGSAASRSSGAASTAGVPSSGAPTAGAPAADGSAAKKPAVPAAATRTLPGVGPTMSAKVPASAHQAIVVYGAGPTTSKSSVALFTRTSGGQWQPGPRWPSHNAIHGWTVRHHEGDLKSPIGVFGLHDAGGLLADPGAKLPYHRSTAFTTPASWPQGYHHDFDYVIAIDYNRVVGTSPADPTRPQGESKGGGIWLHMDHGVGTSACVTVSKDAMRYLLRTLAPADHPVIVMGDKAHLAS
jgi:L,D-peptidoglycan transpeptidase YkuD (ErfK/YbiS/YcfS/YnhG family)